MEAVESSQRVDHGKPQLNEDALVAKDATSKEPLSEDNPVAAPVSKDEEIKEEKTTQGTNEDPAPVVNITETQEPSNLETPSNDEVQTQLKDKGKGKQPMYNTSIPSTSGTSAGTVPPKPSSTPLRLGSEAISMRPPGQDLPWEMDPERPAQKLPVIFKDAVGRTFLVPWRRARTWEGMKMTIDQAFDKVDIPIQHYVLAGHYDLFFTPPMIEGEVIVVNDDPSQSATTTKPPARPSFIVLPDFWEDLIQPGTAVNQQMWPIDRPAPARPWLNAPQNGPSIGINQSFVAPQVGFVQAPPPPALVAAPPPNFIHIEPPLRPLIRRRGKTRVNTGRPVLR